MWVFLIRISMRPVHCQYVRLPTILPACKFEFSNHTLFSEVLYIGRSFKGVMVPGDQCINLFMNYIYYNLFIKQHIGWHLCQQTHFLYRREIWHPVKITLISLSSVRYIVSFNIHIIRIRTTILNKKITNKLENRIRIIRHWLKMPRYFQNCVWTHQFGCNCVFHKSVINSQYDTARHWSRIWRYEQRGLSKYIWSHPNLDIRRLH